MHAGDPELQREGRVLATDHGTFVLFNLYAPNAGERPARARLGFKLQWFAALRERIDKLLDEGREVVVVGDLNIPRSRADVYPSIKWDGLYSHEVRTVCAACACVSGVVACYSLQTRQNRLEFFARRRRQASSVFMRSVQTISCTQKCMLDRLNNSLTCRSFKLLHL